MALVPEMMWSQVPGQMVTLYAPIFIDPCAPGHASRGTMFSWPLFCGTIFEAVTAPSTHAKVRWCDIGIKK